MADERESPMREKLKLLKVVTGQVSISSTVAWINEEASAKENGDLEDFLWSLWSEVVKVAEGFSHDDVKQDVLVQLTREIMLLPDHDVKVQGLRLWSELPVLGAVLRERLNGQPTAKELAKPGSLALYWVDFTAFYARLNGAGIFADQSHSIWMLRAALEEDVTATPELLDCHIETAAQIIEHNGAMLDQQVRIGEPLSEEEERMFRGGSLFHGKSGLSPERWQFWTDRFQVLANETSNDRVKTLALKSSRLMDIWQRRRKE